MMTLPMLTLSRRFLPVLHLFQRRLMWNLYLRNSVYIRFMPSVQNFACTFLQEKTLTKSAIVIR